MCFYIEILNFHALFNLDWNLSMISLAINKEFMVHKCAKRDDLVAFVLASFYNPSSNFCKPCSMKSIISMFSTYNTICLGYVNI